MLQITRRSLEEGRHKGPHTRTRANESRHSSRDVRTFPYTQQELWTSRQRQACSLHEVSYRACFKPQLPAYFIERLSEEGDVVYDPFSGRGTTAVEAALRARRVIANDINPLSAIFAQPRLEVPHMSEIDARLRRDRASTAKRARRSICRCSFTAIPSVSCSTSARI